MKKRIFWIVGGMLFVSAAFFLPGYSGDIWSAVIFGSIASFLYLAVFTVVWMKELHSPAKRKGIAAVVAVLILGSSIFGLINYEDSIRQGQVLKDIRLTIESGLAYNYVHKPLLKTFRLYHTTASDKDMAEIFRAEFDSLITKDSLYQYAPEEKSPSIHIAEVSKDRIVLVGISKYVAGKDSEFENYSGMNGHYQVKGILTSEGVHYEREN